MHFVFDPSRTVGWRAHHRGAFPDPKQHRSRQSCTHLLLIAMGLVGRLLKWILRHVVDAEQLEVTLSGSSFVLSDFEVRHCIARSLLSQQSIYGRDVTGPTVRDDCVRR